LALADNPLKFLIVAFQYSSASANLAGFKGSGSKPVVNRGPRNAVKVRILGHSPRPMAVDRINVYV
jgi:hypothetical protein